MVRGTADVLKLREAQGLQLFIGLQIVGMILLGLAISLFVERAIPAAVFAAGLPALVILCLLLVTVRRGRHLAAAGHIAIVVAFLTTGPIPFTEWDGAGMDVVSAAYVAKTGYPVGFVLVALTGLTLQPHYPAVTTVLLVVYNLLLLGVAMDDPRTEMAQLSQWTEHVMGPALHLGKFSNHLAFTVVVGAVITLATWIARRTVISAARLEQANGQLRRYFSPDVAEHVATADPEFLQPGGSLRHVVVLASDIQGFTPLSRTLGPDATLRLLADYQQRMATAIFRHGGTLDKYIGDGMLATFGATGVLSDPCRRAVDAARDMMAALDALNAGRRAAGEPEIAHRIGIHAGEAMVGNVGSEERLEFTVIGDVVNLADRIEQACKATGDAVLLSRAVVEACPDLAFVPRGAPAMPGVPNPPEVFALDRQAYTSTRGDTRSDIR